jgi:ribosomal-protein-alanine N-acetyltransferase
MPVEERGRTGPTRALRLGDRTFLRRPEPDDEREFLARARASRALHRGLVEPPLTRPQFARFLRRAEQPGQELHFLCRREDGAICGVLNLNDIVRGHLQEAKLGYYALVPFAGQGFMGEGVQLVLRRAFLELALHRIEASVQPTNAASISLLARSGFRVEGFSPRLVRVAGGWRDHLRFAIDIEDWRAWRRRQPAAQRGRRR